MMRHIKKKRGSGMNTVPFRIAKFHSTLPLVSARDASRTSRDVNRTTHDCEETDLFAEKLMLAFIKVLCRACQVQPTPKH